jgi:hypothetical protein
MILVTDVLTYQEKGLNHNKINAYEVFLPLVKTFRFFSATTYFLKSNNMKKR